MSTSTQRTASVEVGVPRAEQDHRQRGARAQLGAEMRDTTRLVGGRAAGPMEVASTTTLLSPGERVRRGTSLRWRLMSRTELEKRVVARPRQPAGKNGGTMPKANEG